MVRKLLLSLIVVFGMYYVFFFSLISDSWKMLFKLIPMLLIIIMAFTLDGRKAPKYKLFIVLGLLFCAIGDYTLQWFIVGIFFFLVGHLFYIRAFITANELKTPRIAKIMISVYGVIVYAIVGGHVFQKGDMLLLVAMTFYVLVILSMAWFSFLCSSRLATIGAVFFIISDTFIAINRFVVSIPYSHEIIMLTYYLAQVLIAFSIMKYSNLRVERLLDK